MSERAINVEVVNGTEDAPTSPGDVLAGKYEVERILGKGAMGVVVAAMHQRLRERVALKFLLPSVSRNPEFNARFQREARVTAKLRSEHVARVTDVGVLESGAPYMVMEYLEGEDLRKILKTEGPFSVERAVDYIVQACEAVAEAHSLGIIHRDLKPSNLFLTKRRDASDLVKVLDFGVSKASLGTADPMESELTSTGSVLGSPRYMSPEQLRNSQNVDARADVWSMATILYELLAGKAPFQAESAASVCAKILNNDRAQPIREVRPDVPPELEAAIQHGLEKELDARSQDIGVFAAEVAQCVDTAAAHQSASRAMAMLTSSGGTDYSSTSNPGSLISLSSTSSSSRSGSLATTSPAPSTSNTNVAWGGAKGTWPKGRVIGVGLVLLVVAAVAIVFATRHAQPEVAAGEPTASAPAATAPAPTQTTTAAPSATAPAAPTAVASATPPEASAEAKPEDSAATTHTSAPVARHYWGRPVAHPAPATTPKPTATATPPPTAAPRPTVNPLEERQ
jgi:serine/threonine protein kinase